MSAWQPRIEEEIALLGLDVPDKKQNVLTEAIMKELDAILTDFEQTAAKDVKGIVIYSAKPGSFIAGADVREIDGITSSEEGRIKAALGQKILNRISLLPVPSVAAIGGYCLGGGLEMALACTYRVAALDEKIRIGLPETKLGILPGFGGTQRLPLLVGMREALGMILAGKTVDVRKALRIGLLDSAVAPGLLVEEAIRFLRERPRPHRFIPRGFSGLLERAPLRDWILFPKALEQAEKKARGHYPAIPAVVKLMKETAALRPPEDVTGKGLIVAPEGLAREAKAFGKLVVTDVSRNLRHLFFLTEARKKYAPYESEPGVVTYAGVLGAGTMGGGIAWALANAGWDVRLKDIRSEPLLGALKTAEEIGRTSMKRRRMTEAEFRRAMGRIAVGLDYFGFRRAELVVEAVVERMEVKQAVLSEVERRVRADAVIATNTSGLSIDEMASVLVHPGRFAGLHFFNPVHRMPLVEIIRGEKTDDRTLATLFSVARRLGKTPILVENRPGFLVNRILIPYILEAIRLFTEGADVRAIDRVAERFGMPMGPLRLADEVGLDVGFHVAEHLERCFGERMALPEAMRKVFEAGLLGRKGGEGFYRYDRAGKPVGVNPRLSALVPRAGKAIPETLMEDRLFLVMLVEAVRALEERVVGTPEDVDIGMIYGTGFPPFRGGLIRWGVSLGGAAVLRRLAPLSELGERFRPPEILKDILG